MSATTRAIQKLQEVVARKPDADVKWRAERDAAVSAAAAAGMTYAEIAGVLGVTRQRVHQLLKGEK